MREIRRDLENIRKEAFEPEEDKPKMEPKAQIDPDIVDKLVKKWELEKLTESETKAIEDAKDVGKLFHSAIKLAVGKNRRI